MIPLRPATIVSFALAALAAGCSSSPGHRGVEAAPVDPLAIVPEVLRPARVEIPANPVTGEAAPEEMQRPVFLRYRLQAGAPVRAIVLTIPGTNGGGGDFDYLARELIRRSGGAVEVWSLERRANLLEDLTGMEAAEREKNLQIAIDYYFRGAQVDGRRFAGFLGQGDVSYLSEFGLATVMRDLKAAIDLVPEASRRTNVFLAGHSLGASQCLAFLGWDFDGDAGTLADAGFNQLAGALLLEGGGSPFPPGSQAAYESAVQGLRAGTSPVFGGFPLITPEVTALLEIAGMAAHPAFDRPEDPADGPEALSVLKDVPFSDDVELLLRFLFSENLLDAILDLPPTWRDFDVTNEALLGLVLDDHFEPIGAQQASFGFVTPQTGVKRRDLLGLPGYVLTDPAPVYGWLDFDEVEGVALTSAAEETTSLARFAEIQWRGPTNFAEWYFALRPSTDSLATGSLTDLPDDSWQATLYGLNAFHSSRIDLPILAVTGGSGLGAGATFASLRGAIADPDRNGNPRSADASVGVRSFAGMNHLDVLAAEAGSPAGEGLWDEILAFLEANSTGTVVVP